jgi:hypothetical protein
MSHEIDRLNFNLAGLFAEEALAAIASDPAYKPAPAHSQQPIPLIDRPWFVASMYVVCALVMGGVISRVIA